jgi:adenylosuccinate synthase
MVEVGGEFGTVTGRRRRCGWLDGVALRYAVRVSGITEIALMKLDVLSEFDTIRIATAYRSGDTVHSGFPRQHRVLYECEPIYEDHLGWQTDITEVRSFDDLPAAAQSYVSRVEEIAEVPVHIVSVGPERASTFEVSR